MTGPDDQQEVREFSQIYDQHALSVELRQRSADVTPVHLDHTEQADNAWRLYAFADEAEAVRVANGLPRQRRTLDRCAVDGIHPCDLRQNCTA